MTATLEQPQGETTSVERHELHVYDSTRPTIVEWSLDDPSSVANAERTFKSRQAIGYWSYQTDSDGESLVIREFNKNALTITQSRPLAGG